MSEPYVYFLKELIYAFANDADDLPKPPAKAREGSNKLIRWCNYLYRMGTNARETEEAKRCMLIGFLKSLKAYCESKNLKLIAIFDQDNVFWKPNYSEVEKSFPFTLVENFPAHLCVISASVLNEGGLDRSPYIYDVYLVSKMFTNEQANEFLKASLPNAGRIKPEELEACRLATGCVPLELANLARQEGASVDEKIKNYTIQRRRELIDPDGRHQRYIETLNHYKQKKYYADLVYLDLVARDEIAPQHFKLTNKPVHDNHGAIRLEPNSQMKGPTYQKWKNGGKRGKIGKLLAGLLEKIFGLGEKHPKTQ